MSEKNNVVPFPTREPADPLLALPGCAVIACDHCGKHILEGAAWIHKGYGCSFCRTSDPFTMIARIAELETGIAKYIEAQQLDRADIRDLAALVPERKP